MAKRQREWANRVKSQIHETLGNCCWAAGIEETPCEGPLELDHIDPATKTHNTRKTEFSWRVSVYRRELKAGQLQLLCAFHNKEKGNRRATAYPPPPGVVVMRDGIAEPF